MTAPATRWSLRHAWLVAACFLVAQLAASYLFSYEDLREMLDETHKSATSEIEQARTLVAGTLASAFGILVWLRREDYPALFRTRWSPGRTAIAVLAALLGILSIAALTAAVAAASGTANGSEPMTSLGTALTAAEMLRAGARSYGPWPIISLATLVVPFYEEVAFRGIMLNGMTRYVSFRWANLIQASVFALAHAEAVKVPALFCGALLAGSFVRRSGGLVPALALHMSTNVIASAVICLAT